MTKLSLAISPCPNDTFMFWAALHRRIDTQGISFDTQFHDIEQLNQLAASGSVDIIKISYAIYPHLSEEYQLLNAGSALGYGNGPLLISKRKVYPDEVPYLKIAIPGERTTANMLLTIAFPSATNKKVYLFSDIEDVVLSNEADAGLLIHETRFTYQQKGLQKIMDMGEYWENTVRLPLPLGAIAVRRALDTAVKHKINALLSESVNYAMRNPSLPDDFVKQHAQAMDLDVCRKHISLYVNEYSINLGTTGKQAVETLFQKGMESGFFSESKEPVFVAEN